MYRRTPERISAYAHMRICYAALMKRTTVLLPDDIAKLLDLEGQRRGLSASHMIREAVETYVGAGPSGVRGLAKFVALGSSGYTDTAERMEELLAEMTDDMARSNGLEPRGD